MTLSDVRGWLICRPATRARVSTDQVFAIAIYDFGAAAGFGLGMTKVQAPPKTMVFPRV